MHICYCYSLKWRYEFSNSKSGVVTFGETKAVHYQSMKTREWILGGNTVDELYEYKNLGVLKNYIGSFSSNVDDNIEKTRNKAGMIFSSHLDRRKVNPLIYVKFWRQACLPSLLFGAELFTLTPGLLLKLERCQSWFLKHIFYVPSFTPGPILLKMSGLNSVASEIAIKKLLFLGRLITEPNMAPTVRNLFQCRVESYFNTNVTSAGVLLSISESLVKYDLFHHFESWYNSSTFPSYENWKRIVRDRIRVFEKDAWLQFCDNHPDIHIIQTCFENLSPPDFWSLADEYPDLVTRLHTQARLMGGFGLNGSVPWLKDREGALCFICKEDVENTYHFFLDCPQFKENFDSVWRNLQLKITRSNPTDGVQIANFIKNLNRQNKVMLLVGGLSLPFDNQTTTLVKKFVSSAVGKIYKLRTEKLRELEAPWLKN